MNMRQMAVAAGADRKWLVNSAAILRRPLRTVVTDAKWWGLVRLLSKTLELPLRSAAGVATKALASPRATTPVVRADPTDSINLRLDLDRYGSVFLGNLSRALVHETPKRRGRPSPPQNGDDAIAAARKYGVDIGLLESALTRTPADRLAIAEANASFLHELRRTRK